MSSSQLVERRNCIQLKWKVDYQQNKDKDTTQYSNLICQCNNNQKYFNKKCQCSVNWNWYLLKHSNAKNVPTLRGHSICDIGNKKLLSIGNKTKSDTIDVYQIEKDFTKCKKLKTFGNVPTQRFAHSAEYIAPIDAVFFCGGFDSKMNYNDSRLLFLDNMEWFTLAYNTDIGVRAYHSTASRIIYDDKLKQNKFEIYLFGGQWCNGGPYEYLNNLFKFTFLNIGYPQNNSLFNDVGYFECDEIQTYGSKPHTRSQCYSWINDDKLYVFGGCYDVSTLNDLWCLDLNTLYWTQIKYDGLIGAPLTFSIKPTNFRIHPVRKPCYFDKKLKKLIVIHYGFLNDIQREYVKYKDNINEFEERMMNKFNKNKKLKRKINKNTFSAETFIFSFDIILRKWDIIKTGQNNLDSIPPHIPLTTFVRIGQYMVLVGGGYTKSQLKTKNNRANRNILSRNHMEYLYVLKLPMFRIINTISWSRERLIWIGHCKMNKNKNKCFLYKLPKQMILLILSFLNITPTYNIINTQNNMKAEIMTNDVKDEKEEGGNDLFGIDNKMETMMGYEENNKLLRFNNDKLTDNTQFIFNKQIIENINYMNNGNNNKQYKSSPIGTLINTVGVDKNKEDDMDDCVLKQGITLMGYCNASPSNINKNEHDQDDEVTCVRTKGGELLMGYAQIDQKRRITL